MNRNRLLPDQSKLWKIGAVMAGSIGVICDVFLSSANDEDIDERRLHDSELSGELNHRTGRMDSGLDPYGWYRD